jgi:hypothetical protein
LRGTFIIAGLCGFALIASARTGYGQPADDATVSAEAGKEAAPAADGKATDKPAKAAPVGSLRSSMEQDLAEIGKIAQKAQRDGDMVKIACVTDKQDRAEGVMDVATPEIAVLQGEGADPTSQSFAGEKLEAAALRLGKLLDEARACTGSPAEAGDQNGENVVDEGSRLPPEDPTASPGSGPGGLPPLDPSRPPVASPVR